MDLAVGHLVVLALVELREHRFEVAAADAVDDVREVRHQICSPGALGVDAFGKAPPRSPPWVTARTGTRVTPASRSHSMVCSSAGAYPWARAPARRSRSPDAPPDPDRGGPAVARDRRGP